MRGGFKLLYLIGLLGAGCGSSGDFPVARVTGQVVCDDKPVPFVTVFFEPLQTGNQTLVGKQGIGQADAEGRFSISTYSQADGAVVGKHRVRVMGPDRDSYPDFSCPCRLDSEVDVAQVEVKSGEKNEFQVVLTKRDANQKLSLEEQEVLKEAAERQRTGS